MSDSKKYYDKTYFSWQKNIGKLGGQINMSKFVEYIKLSDVVLDFGCGGGYLLKNLDCKEKIGIEVNPEAKKEALSNNIKIFSDASEIESRTIDIIISNHALEHVEEPLNELRKLYKVLKEGGRIVLALPIDDYRNAKKYDKKDINNHLYTWNIQLIGNCLRAAGFDNIDAKVYTHAWPRFYPILFKYLPIKLFDFISYLSAVKNNRRQIIAIATK